MILENIWQEIRDHSFIQNHSRPFRFPAPWQCFFSSVHSFSTGFRSEDWIGSRSLVLCSVTHFCVVFEVCVWIIVRLEDPNMAHYKISNRVSHLLIFYLLVFDIIHDAMCLNKLSRTSSRNVGQKHKKHQYISLYTWGTFHPCVHQTHLVSVMCHVFPSCVLIWFVSCPCLGVYELILCQLCFSYDLSLTCIFKFLSVNLVWSGLIVTPGVPVHLPCLVGIKDIWVYPRLHFPRSSPLCAPWHLECLLLKSYFLSFIWP